MENNQDLLNWRSDPEDHSKEICKYHTVAVYHEYTKNKYMGN